VSHVNLVKVAMTDRAAIKAAAEKQNLKFLGEKTHELYNSQKATGLGFTLPGWSYPVVIDPATGIAAYDNYGEHWGKQIELDKLVQGYGVEVTRAEANRLGALCEERVLANGDIELEMSLLVTA
jgi:hypothetical protein